MPGQTDIQTLSAAFSAHPALAYAVHQAAEKFPAFFAQNPLGATASVAAAAGIHNPFGSGFPGSATTGSGSSNNVGESNSTNNAGTGGGDDLATIDIAGGVGTPSNLGNGHDSVMLDLAATPGSTGRPGSSGVGAIGGARRDSEFARLLSGGGGGGGSGPGGNDGASSGVVDLGEGGTPQAGSWW
ncbi:alpha-1,2-Mannosidase [Pseudozyma hubeiensis]|nr:alpha-1,2-Mannosidase [Pseudozyma hubeiensis]